MKARVCRMGCCIATFTAFTMAFIVCTVHLAIQHTDCDVADIELPESRTHLPPSDNQSVQRIAVASCFQVGSEPSSALWRHVRHSFVAEHFVWLGDNAYSDGVSMTHKRARYHAARHAKYYADNNISLPNYPKLDNKEIDYICNKIKRFYQNIN